MALGVVKLVELAIAYSIGFCFTFLVLFRTLLRSFKDQRWGVRTRKRPICLQSTEKWDHNLVTLQHDGIKLHYVSAGSDRKPLIVFLHGFPEMWYSWRYQLEYFKDNYRVVALSMRGYGDSDSPTSVSKYKVDLLVEDVKGLILSLGASECILVGHDWGGAVAWRVAMTAPEFVSKLIIMNSAHPRAFIRCIRTSFQQFMKSWYMFFFQLPWIPEYLLTRCDVWMFRDIWRAVGLSHDDQEAFLYTYTQPGALTGPINYYRAAFRRSLSYETSKIKVPTLLIWGTDDLALSEEMAAMSADYCEDIRIKKIQGGNHFIQQHKPSEVNTFMEEFLQ